MNKAKNTIAIILPLLLGVFLVYYQFQSLTPQQWIDLKAQFAQANPWYLLLSVIFMKISHASRAYRWKYSLAYMNYPLRFANSFMAIAIGYLINLTIPRSGEISRAAIIKKYEKIPFDKAFGTIVAERVIDLMVLLLLTMVVMLWQMDALYTFIMVKIPFQKLFTYFIGIGVIGILLTIFILLFKKNWLIWIKDKLSGFGKGIMSVYQMPTWPYYLLHTIIIWASFISTFYFGILSIDSLAHLDFSIVLIAFVVGSFAISFTNGGIGAFPFLIAQILGIYGINKVDATAFGWILWSTQTAMVVVLGFLSFVFLPIVNKEK